jgi:hypothetical protein
MGDRIGSEVNTDVTITPVLDLSQVKKDATQIPGIAGAVPIQASVSYAGARSISGAVRERTLAEQGIQAGTTVTFEQNNYSPESLSHVEIYRQTRNQLSQVKRAIDYTQYPQRHVGSSA